MFRRGVVRKLTALTHLLQSDTVCVRVRVVLQHARRVVALARVLGTTSTALSFCYHDAPRERGG
jgi:hypothetical protein